MDESIKQKLLAGLPLRLRNICNVYPLSLLEIADLGEENNGYELYRLYLSNLIVESEQLKENIENLSTFDIIVNNFLYSDDNYRETIINALELFIREKITFACDDIQAFFYVGDIDSERILNKDNYDKFKYFLQIQNCLENKNNNKNMDFNVDVKNEKARKMLEKLKKRNDTLERIKSKSKDPNSLELSDLISILSSNSNLRLPDIYILDMYRFNNQFNRMKILSEYKVNIQSLIAGADSEKIELKHFISKI